LATIPNRKLITLFSVGLKTNPVIKYPERSKIPGRYIKKVLNRKNGYASSFVMDREKCKIALVPMDQEIADINRQAKTASEIEVKFLINAAKLHRAKITDINR